MLSTKPWKLMDFLTVIVLLSVLLLGGIFSNLLSATAPDVPAQRQNEAVNFAVSLCLYGAILGLVHLIVRTRQTNWPTAFGFTSTRQMSALLLALGVTCIVLPIAWYLLGPLSVKVMEHLGRRAVPQTSVQVLQTSASVGPQIFLAILAVLIRG